MNVSLPVSLFHPSLLNLWCTKPSPGTGAGSSPIGLCWAQQKCCSCTPKSAAPEAAARYPTPRSAEVVPANLSVSLGVTVTAQDSHRSQRWWFSLCCFLFFFFFNPTEGNDFLAGYLLPDSSPRCLSGFLTRSPATWEPESATCRLLTQRSPSCSPGPAPHLLAGDRGPQRFRSGVGCTWLNHF